MEDIRQISWIDLDNTLIATNAMWWIIDKNNPDTYLFKISQYEGTLIKNGFYKGHELPIYYNGVQSFLNKETWAKIQRIKRLTLDDIGLSFREYTDANLINQQLSTCVFYIDRFKQLKDHTINILTARGNRDGHSELLSMLKTKMEAQGLTIHDAYFVNDPTCVVSDYNSPEKKLLCIIEKVVGFKIKNNEFIHIADESYQISHFYDDEDINIDACKNINKFIKDLLDRTEPWLKEKIEGHLSIQKPVLYTYLLNSNELNPFIQTEIKIEL